jgi:hypothetical protein
MKKKGNQTKYAVFSCKEYNDGTFIGLDLWCSHADYYSHYYDFKTKGQNTLLVERFDSFEKAKKSIKNVKTEGFWGVVEVDKGNNIYHRGYYPQTVKFGDPLYVCELVRFRREVKGSKLEKVLEKFYSKLKEDKEYFDDLFDRKKKGEKKC